MEARYSDGASVRINKPTLREHGVTGKVQSYDDSTQWYWVELDKGPPWRGKYEHSELMIATSSHTATNTSREPGR